MKKLSKVLALVLAFALVLGLGATAFAETSTPSITIVPNNPETTASLAINYTYYQILEASIDTDPTVTQSTGATATEGKVAYYVTTQDRATQLTNTNLFNVTKVDDQDKWYVSLKSNSTTAQNIIDAFEAETFDLSKFSTGTFDKATNETQAESGTLAAGYYYITSSLGTKAAVETLTAVTINEKNDYPDIGKTEASDFEIAGINEDVPYTITVEIPESVASKAITITDTITKGLTMNTAVTVSGAVSSPAYTSATWTLKETKEDGSKVYTIVIPAETVLANAGKTLTFTYSATVNENAVVLSNDGNSAELEYDEFHTAPTETVTTHTVAFTLQKVDGTDHTAGTTTELAGAEFSLWDAETDGNQIKLVKVSDGVYRVATTAEAGASGFESAVIVAGTATINGLNDATYYLQEDKEPTGYNKLEGRKSITASDSTAEAGVDIQIDNNKGATLPSTGGIGTTIFYIVGAVLVLGAGVLLVTRKRMTAQ